MSGLRARLDPLMKELRDKWPFVLGLFVFVVALWAQTNAMVGVFFDDGIYVQLAKSLAEGTGYRSMHLPDAPVAVHYPPAYPFLLSLLWRLWPSFPENVILFELFDAAALAAAAVLIGLHARRTGMPAAPAAIALAIGFTAFPLLTLVGVRFSEPAFLALAAGALYAADGDSGGRGHALLAGFLAGAATLTRSIGVAVIGGIVIGLWIRGRRRDSIVAAATATVVVSAWVAFIVAHRDGIDPLLVSNYGTYGQFAGQAGVLGLLSGLDLAAFDPLRRLLFPAVPGIVAWSLTALLVVAIGVGIRQTFKPAPSLGLTVLFYLVIVTLWPYPPDRFVWIVLPWLSFLLAAGVRWNWRTGGVTRWVGIVVLAAVALGFIPRQVTSLAARSFAITAVAPSERFALLAAGIAAALPDDAVIATDGEALIYLYTQKQTAPVYLYELRGRDAVPFGTDIAVAYWCRQGVTHVAASADSPDVRPLFQDLTERTDIQIRTLFEVTEGPTLMELHCAS